MATLICDIETYHGYFLAAFRRHEDGKIVSMEMSDRSKLDRDRLRNILMQNKIVTFNGLNYDMPLLWYACEEGSTNEKLKAASDKIIRGNLKYWEVPRALGVFMPKTDHIDLIETPPGVRQSLKMLNGRLHGRRMQDLPIDPDATLTHADMDLLTRYCVNDLEATALLYNSLQDALALRESLGAEYEQDFRSKSDSQIGESIIKYRVQKMTGKRVEKARIPKGQTFHYNVPDFVSFERPELRQIVEKLRATEFVVKENGKVDMPRFLSAKKVVIGNSKYSMGIGGLHSTEECRALVADEDTLLIDADVASQYPSIIMKLGLYPKAIGKEFLDVYGGIKTERLKAKREKNKVKDQGLKIALNGVYGKLGSVWSPLYAPHLMIAVTLTGQLSLLMLIERAEDAGIPVVSGNTDGVIFQCPKTRHEDLLDICAKWEQDTGFDLEYTGYNAIYNANVNTYIAIKDDGSAKRKGFIANPWGDNDLRGQMMKNPQMTICSDAALAYLQHGTPVEETIRACNDIRGFVTVVKVTGGAEWQGEYLGKVVRYIWATEGEPIYYVKRHPTTGNVKKVSKTDGCQPLMDLPDEFPSDIDYQHYIDEANDLLRALGALEAKPIFKPVRFTKKHCAAWFALAA